MPRKLSKLCQGPFLNITTYNLTTENMEDFTKKISTNFRTLLQGRFGIPDSSVSSKSKIVFFQESKAFGRVIIGRMTFDKKCIWTFGRGQFIKLTFGRQYQALTNEHNEHNTNYGLQYYMDAQPMFKRRKRSDEIHIIKHLNIIHKSLRHKIKFRIL